MYILIQFWHSGKLQIRTLKTLKGATHAVEIFNGRNREYFEHVILEYKDDVSPLFIHECTDISRYIELVKMMELAVRTILKFQPTEDLS